MQSVILAGGKGLRLSQDMPKALLKLKDKTLLEYQLEFISPFVDKIVLALGYKASEVIEFCKTLPKDIQDKLIFFSRIRTSWYRKIKISITTHHK